MCLGIPGRVTEIFQAHGVLMGKIDFDGIRKEVCLEYIPDIQVGDYAIIHVGFAITRLDEKSANETLDLMRQAGILKPELDPDVALAMETAIKEGRES